MNTEKAHAEKGNKRYYFAINSIAKLTTSYYIFEALICACLCCFGILLDYLNPYDHSFSNAYLIAKIFVFFVGINIVYIVLEIVSELCKDPADSVNVHIINAIAKILFSAVEMIFFKFMLPHVCVFAVSIIAFGLCIVYKIRARNQRACN